MSKPIRFFHPEQVILLMLLVGVLFSSCKQPEVITAGRSSEISEDDEEPTDTTGAATSATFRHLIIGEGDPIESMDPLLVENSSGMRAIQLVYEGLIRYDRNGELQPQLAREWEVGEDSLTYRFTLRNDAYYQDNSVFDAGRGRKVVAEDVKFAFERMARNHVPDRAAQLFMSIEGFEPYFKEQRELYMPEQRELEGVTGIEVSNDSTVIFNLAESDPDFLKHLASPQALIYPREAIGDDHFVRPVGSGLFEFTQQQGDSVYIFTRDNEYYGDVRPRLNRVDIRTYSRDTDRFRDFAAGEVHLLPELGPQILESVTDSEGELQESYREDYRMITPGGNLHYILHWNQEAQGNPEGLAALLASAEEESLRGEIPSGFISVEVQQHELEEEPSVPETVYATRPAGTFSAYFTSRLSDVLTEAGSEFQIVPIRTPVKQTQIYLRSNLINAADAWEESENTLIRYEVLHAVLVHRQVEQLQFNEYPWWIDLSRTTLPSADEF